MVLFNGRSARIVSLMNFVVVLCVVLPLFSIGIAGIRKFKEADQSISFSDFLAAERLGKGLLVLLLLTPALLVLLKARRAVSRDYPSIFASERGLHFPFFPGGESGRVISWECLSRVELGELPHDPRISAVARGSTYLLFERPLFLIIFLNCDRSQAWVGNRVAKALYDLNDRTAVMPQEGAERMIIEFIQVTSCSQRSVARTINALISDPTLRTRFCESPSKFVVVDRDDGSAALFDASMGTVLGFGRGDK